jgi:hypothetical protein
MEETFEEGQGLHRAVEPAIMMTVDETNKLINKCQSLTSVFT